MSKKIQPGEFDIQMFGSALVHGDIGQVDVRLCSRWQLALGLLGSLAQTLHRLSILE